MLPLPMLLIMEDGLNRYIQLDPHAKEKLIELNGKTLSLTIQGLSIALCLVFNKEHIYLQRTCLGTPDLQIISPPFTLLELLSSENPQSILTQKNMEIQGDAILAQKIKAFFQSIQIDWAYYLSLFTGEIIAQQSTTFIKKNLKRLKLLSFDLRNNLGEYLQEEIRVTPHRNALEFFHDDVDDLRSKVDLLDARVAQLIMETK